MKFQEWLEKNNITEKEKLFCYTAWFNHQATQRHKKNLQLVNPKQIKIFGSTIEKEIIERFKLQDKETLEYLTLQPDLNQFGQDISSIPKHLISDYAVKFNWRPKNNLICLESSYQHFVFDLNLIKDLKFTLDNKEYSIYLPKTSEEVTLGGLLLANCMGAIGGNQLMAEFVRDPIGYQKKYRYLDAHIVHKGGLVGVLALEEILKIKDSGSPHRSLFVNYANGYNVPMERKLIDIIHEKYGIESKPYFNTWGGYSAYPVRVHSSFEPYGLTRQIKNTVEMLKSKL